MRLAGSTRSLASLAALAALAACQSGGSRRAAPPPADAGPTGLDSRPLANGDASDPTHPHAPPLAGTCAAAAVEHESDDQHLDALLDEAGAHLDQTAWADAFTCADMAADLSPRSIEAHHLRAAALAGAGRDDEAAVAYGMALALDPEDPETLRAAADFYVNVRADKSRDTTALGLELARRGFARATARRRGQVDLRARLALLEAQALNDLGQADEALDRAGEAVRLESDLIDAIHEKGVALFNLSRFEPARVQFERVLEAVPDDAYAHHLLGLTLEQLGERAEADRHFARARAQAPDEFPAPVVISTDEVEQEIARVVAGLPAERAARVRAVPIEVVDFPDPTDLRSVSPPFPPTILGLYRGLPVGVEAAPGEDVPARAIVLYRLNLARAVRTRAELGDQIERTLLHEIGHLEGLDEDDLRRADLE